jgi:hypothetical protein
MLCRKDMKFTDSKWCRAGLRRAGKTFDGGTSVERISFIGSISLKGGIFNLYCGRLFACAADRAARLRIDKLYSLRFVDSKFRIDIHPLPHIVFSETLQMRLLESRTVNADGENTMTDSRKLRLTETVAGAG